LKGEKYGDADLQGKLTTPGTAKMLRGYAIPATDTTEYKRMLWTIEESGGSYAIRNYEVLPGKDAETEGTMRAGTGLAYLGANEPTSLDFNDKYLVIGYGGSGYGQVEVRDRSTLAVVYQASGDGSHRDMGRGVAIEKKLLEPGKIEAHYIHYSNMRRESERVSYFHNGLITLITTQKTVTEVTSKPQIETDAKGNPVIDKDG
jgi:hypothetical protein